MRRAPNIGFIVECVTGNARYYRGFMLDELLLLNRNSRNLVDDLRLEYQSVLPEEV